MLRADGRRQLTVRLAPMPAEIAGERVAFEFGFSLHETFAEKFVGNWLGPMESFAVVAEVFPGSHAERGGLEPGGRPQQDQRRAARVVPRRRPGPPARPPR